MKLASLAFCNLLFVCITTLVASEGAPYPTPYDVPCGLVTELKLSTKNDFVLKWSIPKYKDEPTLEADEKFAEITIAVKQGFSIGKYDFELSGNPCLAMAEGANAYNPETREVVADSGERTVKLLYKVKSKDTSFNFIYKYSIKDELSTSLPEELKRVQLPFNKAEEKDVVADKGTKKSKKKKKKSSSGKKKQKFERNNEKW